MPDRTRFLLALVWLGLTAPAARADTYITVNGLPCGTLCRAWMGIKLPAETSAADEDRPAREEAEPARRSEPQAPHKKKVAKPAHAAVAKAKPAPAKEIAHAKAAAAETAETAPAKPVPAPEPKPTPLAVETPAPVATPTPVASQPPEPVATPVATETPAASPTPVASETPAPVAAASRPAMAGPKETAAPEVAAADPGAKVEGERDVLIVLAKPDVKEIADLHDMTVVLAGVATISDDRLKAAFAAAGAANAQFKQGAINDVDEVGKGSVAAAIVAVVKPEIASAFPEVPGYHLLRVEVATGAGR